jgi:hypothetical protein
VGASGEGPADERRSCGVVCAGGGVVVQLEKLFERGESIARCGGCGSLIDKVVCSAAKGIEEDEVYAEATCGA